MTIRSVTFTKSSEGSSARSRARNEDFDYTEDELNGLIEDARSSLMRVEPVQKHDDAGIILDIDTPEAFLPLLEFKRFKGARGGRGGAKSHFFCEQIVENMATRHTRQACLREVQNSIRDSVKQLIEDKIAKLNVAHLFHVTDREIICPSTDSLCIFRGLRNHTVSSIKSLEGFTDAFVEEAQTISQRSLDVMVPTFRSNSQISFAWNPNEPTDPVDKMFEENYFIDGDENFVCVNVNYWDNPWFPEELRQDMQRDRRRDPEKYDHVWAGGYVRNAEARVFKNWTVEPFITPLNAHFMQGGDWGYSIDPTVLIRGFIGDWIDRKPVPNDRGKCLFIDHEAYRVGVEIDHTPQLFDQLVKDRGVPVLSEMKVARTVPTIADSSNPQGISYMKRHGYPLIKGAVKGPNSIKEGIIFLQGFDIYVHPRCVHTIDELTHFRHKIDPHTKLVLPELEDKKNHVIDSMRYMVEPLRRPDGRTLFGSY